MTAVRLGSGGPWEEVVGYSRVVAVGAQAWVSGGTATVDGAVVHVGDMGAQARVAFSALVEALNMLARRNQRKDTKQAPT